MISIRPLVLNIHTLSNLLDKDDHSFPTSQSRLRDRYRVAIVDDEEIGLSTVLREKGFNITEFRRSNQMNSEELFHAYICDVKGIDTASQQQALDS